MAYLGLDIGTSAVKAVVLNDDGILIADASAGLKTHQPKPGWSEQNPEDWLSAVKVCCGELSEKLGETWRGMKAIGLSGQMHGAVLLDKSRCPIRPAILWNDSRSVEQSDMINEATTDIETKAGIFAMPGFTAPKVLWCAQHEPDTHSQIAHILLPKDYIRLALTGELATDMADAAGTLWLDQKNRIWDDELCQASRTDMNWLPRLVEGSEVSGLLGSDIADELGLPAGIPVAGGGGDAAAGALGIGAINKGDAFISLGTSGQLFVSDDIYRPAPETVVHCYAHCVPDRWFQMACMLNGASPMSWFAEFTGKPITHLLADAEAAARSPLFLPYLTGERTPHNDANIRGTFYGLHPDTTPGEAMRAVVEAIAYSFADCYDCLQQAGTTLTSVAAIGGGTRSDYVLQTLADVLELPIQRYRGSETGPALGAARLAMVASGNHQLSEIAIKPEQDQIFEPRSQKNSYHAENLTCWRTLYQVLKPFAAT